MSATPRAVVLVSGEGSNLQAIIDQVRRGALGLTLAGVVSDRPGVRALERAAAAGIAAHMVDHASDPPAFPGRLAAILTELQPDLVILAGFMRILPSELVDEYRGRMLNVHPSLLPKYPGLHTYRRALEAGDREHGSTVHFVIPALDAGPGIIQYRVPVHPGDTEASLRERVRAGEHLIYPRAIAWLAAGRVTLRDGAAWLDGERLTQPVVVDEARGAGASVAESPRPDIVCRQ
ncbi:MAG: phosphoribosylglycinamide formyltransferase [Chromatiales bacterium]|nr:phosphoribosylglycinamide formyltransferase [Chromatiales bacterium]